MLAGKRSMSICLFISLSGCENHLYSPKQTRETSKNVLLYHHRLFFVLKMYDKKSYFLYVHMEME